MLTNRLDHESDMIMRAVATGGMTPHERKLYLEAVRPDELLRITRQRLSTRMEAQRIIDGTCPILYPKQPGADRFRPRFSFISTF